MLTILGRPTSINVRKVLWTCDELEVAYVHETEWATAGRPSKAPEFLALNPNGLVPVIRDDDFVLWESNAICRYLAARERRVDLMPEDAKDRAVVDQWMDWQATELNDSWRYAFLALVRKSPAHVDPAAIAASAEAWNRQMAILDARLERTGAFVAGDAFTLADIVAGLSLHRWRSTPIVHARLDAVDSYEKRLRRRAAFGRYATADLP